MIVKKVKAIYSSVTVLGLLKKKKKDKRNVWVAIFRTPTYNMIPMKLKDAVSADAPVQHV